MSSEVRTTQGKTATLEWEKIRVFPDNFYMSGNTPGAEPYIQVVTHDIGYRRLGKNTSRVTGDDLASIREGMKFDLVYIALHRNQFSVSYVGEEQSGSTAVKTIRLTLMGTNRDTVWKIDPQTGRILSAVDHSRSGDTVAEFSDFRLVSGLVYPFRRHVTAQGVTSDITITEYEVNPAIDAKLFDRPGDLPTDLLTIRVLQSESVPYVQQYDGGVSTNCSN
jgi:outer membrane lipoprotein-sorting protein